MLGIFANQGIKGDHPREYGENDDWKEPLEEGGGSSPRIRGKFSKVPFLSAASGIIPANTGKISRASSARRNQEDHPREYGENHVVFDPPHLERGSSPRIRGKSWIRWAN